MRNWLSRRTTVSAVAGLVLLATGTAAASAATTASTHTTTTAVAKTTKATVWISAPTSVGAKTSDILTVRGLVSYRNTPLGGRTVVLQARHATANRWTSIEHKTTVVGTGKVGFVVRQSGAVEQYRLVLLSGGKPDATSAVVRVRRTN